MTDQQREIGTRIRERLLARIPEPYKLRIGYRLPISEEIPLVETNDADLDAIITKDGENYAFFKIELRSVYFYGEKAEKAYPHVSKRAKDAGFAYAIIYREDGDKEEFLIRDLRKSLSNSHFVPVCTFDELMYILFDEPEDVPSQLDWKMGIWKLLNNPNKEHWHNKDAFEYLLKVRVQFDAATKQCYLTPDDERGFFGKLFYSYNDEYICRYTTYETLERILRTKKQSVCSVVCMNDETECYYADEYLKERGGTDDVDSLESNYVELNKCQISSCTDVRSADKLSLWRLYGDDAKGVCLKFKVDQELLKQKGFFLYHMSYTYLLSGQHYELDSVSDLKKLKVKGFTFDFKMWHIWKHFFKPVHYWDEHEVRLLYFKKDFDEYKWIKTGDSQILAPVIEFGIEKGKNEFPLVLSEIILGPKFPEAATNAVQIKYLKELQQIEEDGDCPVTLSKIKGYR